MKDVLISQYCAAIKMLKNTINLCPENVWDNREEGNPAWKIAYHTLFYSAFYLAKKQEFFVPWAKHIEHHNDLRVPTEDDLRGYTKEEIAEYADLILISLDASLSKMEADETCDFFWIPGTELEMHIYNLRHIQHHTAQLVERFRQNGVTGFGWIIVDEK